MEIFWAGPAAHAAPPSTTRCRIGRPAASFLQGCLKEQPHRSFPGQCTDRTGATGVEVLPGRERLVLGAARYNTGKGSSCKIYLTVLPQTPVRGARLDRGPPSHQRSISLCDERVGGEEGGRRERESRKDRALKRKGRLTQRTPKYGWMLSGVHTLHTLPRYVWMDSLEESVGASGKVHAIDTCVPIYLAVGEV